MRIDSGPNFDEIKDSVENGNVVTFRNNAGEEVRCVVVDAKVDPENGRAALMVEEQATGAVYFARYNHRGGRSSCGDLVTWHSLPPNRTNDPAPHFLFGIYRGGTRVEARIPEGRALLLLSWVVGGPGVTNAFQCQLGTRERPRRCE